ncbi:hypothetical protein EIP86_000213 [Pleurotus ostreatoroseus]|nr:hypothetical protein EIP86_000213 [Pleurotus ostreatoroseus]
MSLQMQDCSTISGTNSSSSGASSTASHTAPAASFAASSASSGTASTSSGAASPTNTSSAAGKLTVNFAALSGVALALVGALAGAGVAL